MRLARLVAYCYYSHNPMGASYNYLTTSLETMLKLLINVVLIDLRSTYGLLDICNVNAYSAPTVKL